MELEKPIHRINPPCAKCPYKLGQIHTPVSPCPQCRESGYQVYERFKKMPEVGKQERG